MLVFLVVLPATIGLIAFSMTRSTPLPGRSKLVLLAKVWKRPSRRTGPSF